MTYINTLLTIVAGYLTMVENRMFSDWKAYLEAQEQLDRARVYLKKAGEKATEKEYHRWVRGLEAPGIEACDAMSQRFYAAQDELDNLFWELNDLEEAVAYDKEAEEWELPLEERVVDLDQAWTEMKRHANFHREAKDYLRVNRKHLAEMKRSIVRSRRRLDKAVIEDQLLN